MLSHTGLQLVGLIRAAQLAQEAYVTQSLILCHSDIDISWLDGLAKDLDKRQTAISQMHS